MGQHLTSPNAQLAQSVEQGIENPRVRGSIPRLGTIILSKLLIIKEKKLSAKIVPSFIPIIYYPKSNFYCNNKSKFNFDAINIS